MAERLEAADLIARWDRDWRDDERCIRALARFFQVPRHPQNGAQLHIELERMWRLTHRTSALEKWRDRAWYYRQVLIHLGRQYVTGFRRTATPGETRPARWTTSHLLVLVDAVDTEKRRIRRASPEQYAAAADVPDTTALKALLAKNYFRSPMTIDNAKKLLQRARRGDRK